MRKLPRLVQGTRKQRRRGRMFVDFARRRIILRMFVG